jgi:hypothetical protein
MIFRLFNILIFLASLPEALIFSWLSRGDIRKQQTKILRAYINKNRETVFGKDNGFSAVLADFSEKRWRKLPVQDYSSLGPYIREEMKGNPNQLTREKILLLEPTSGSTGGTKLVPYTGTLGKEFLKGIKPWLFSVYLYFPGIFTGTAYWSISPAGSLPPEQSVIPVGFYDDAGYTGILAPLFRKLFPVPSDLKKLSSIVNFRHATSLFLLAAENLSLISIWNPSYLEILIQYIHENRVLLLEDLERKRCSIREADSNDDRILKQLEIRVTRKRINFLKGVFELQNPGLKQIWPRLYLISCWTEGPSRDAAARLTTYMKGISVQGKGLLATEGIFTIPLGELKGFVPAFRSHYFEFKSCGSEREILGLHELEEGKEYELIITTGGGLYRYQMKDRIRVNDFWHNLPLLSFLGRSSTSDICGEKISTREADLLVEHILTILPKIEGCDFLLSAVQLQDRKPFYVLFCFSGDRSQRDLKNLFFDNSFEVAENFLQKNFHYHYARHLGQLDPVEILFIPRNRDEYIQSLLMELGRNPGNRKPGVLNLYPELGWRFYMSTKNTESSLKGEIHASDSD